MLPYSPLSSRFCLGVLLHSPRKATTVVPLSSGEATSTKARAEQNLPTPSRSSASWRCYSSWTTGRKSFSCRKKKGGEGIMAGRRNHHSRVLDLPAAVHPRFREHVLIPIGGPFLLSSRQSLPQFPIPQPVHVKPGGSGDNDYRIWNILSITSENGGICVLHFDGNRLPMMYTCVGTACGS